MKCDNAVRARRKARRRRSVAERARSCGSAHRELRGLSRALPVRACARVGVRQDRFACPPEAYWQHFPSKVMARLEGDPEKGRGFWSTWLTPGVLPSWRGGGDGDGRRDGGLHRMAGRSVGARAGALGPSERVTRARARHGRGRETSRTPGSGRCPRAFRRRGSRRTRAASSVCATATVRTGTTVGRPHPERAAHPSSIGASGTRARSERAG